jgi:hypothetical protein
MERLAHQADDQQPGAAVLGVLFQFRSGHYRIHDSGSRGDVPSVGEAEPVHEGDVGVAAEDEGDPGEVQRRSAEAIARDDEALQGARRQSDWVYRPTRVADADLLRPILGAARHSPIYPGAAGRPVGASIFLVASGSSGCAPEWPVHDNEPGQVLKRQSCAVQHPAPRTGGSVDVVDAKDDDHAVHQPAAGIHQQDDAVDDAPDVRLLHVEFRGWPGPLLDCIQRRGYSGPGVHNRLGADHYPSRLRTNPGRARCGRRRTGACACVVQSIPGGRAK